MDEQQLRRPVICIFLRLLVSNSVGQNKNNKKNGQVVSKEAGQKTKMLLTIGPEALLN
jgi:hypothetical protein